MGVLEAAMICCDRRPHSRGSVRLGFILRPFCFASEFVCCAVKILWEEDQEGVGEGDRDLKESGAVTWQAEMISGLRRGRPYPLLFLRVH
jgi:hypothetical protein